MPPSQPTSSVELAARLTPSFAVTPAPCFLFLHPFCAGLEAAGWWHFGFVAPAVAAVAAAVAAVAAAAAAVAAAAAAAAVAVAAAHELALSL